MQYNKNMEINGTEIYERILEMLTIRGIKNKDFYEKTGITRQALARWKSGSLPSIDILYLIKEELNVSLDWLITGKNEQDGTDPAAPYQIVNRIDNYIEESTNHKKYESNIVFYNCIKDIVHPQELQDWLYGRQNIDISKIVKIADTLGESVQYFITGSHISSSEYTEKYNGQKESENAEFYKEFANLDKEGKGIVKQLTQHLFEVQVEKK